MAIRQPALEPAAVVRRLALTVGVGVVETADLDDFVAAVDDLGGLGTPEAIDFMADFSLRHRSVVDTRLDGFDPTYMGQQLDLYREVSGRDVDQEANEITDFKLDEFLHTPNPYGSIEAGRVAHHARTILTVYLVADLQPGARVLDMGCGWGLSTEVLAFCGCEVTAVDINADFTDLVARRAGPRGYDVRTIRSSFDEFESDDRFDLVLFYECLHHAIAPWTVIERLAGNVAAGGKIAFAGEPIQDLYWPQWGLRLDPHSVYSIRKHGWFESGWTADFLHRCFDRAGFELTVMPGIGFQHGEIGVAVRRAEEVATPSPHWGVARIPGEAEPPPPGAVERVARGVARRIFGR